MVDICNVHSMPQYVTFCMISSTEREFVWFIRPSWCRHPGVLRHDVAGRVKDRATEDNGNAANCRKVGTDLNYRRRSSSADHSTDRGSLHNMYESLHCCYDIARPKHTLILSWILMILWRSHSRVRPVLGGSKMSTGKMQFLDNR